MKSPLDRQMKPEETILYWCDGCGAYVEPDHVKLRDSERLCARCGHKVTERIREGYDKR